VSLERHRAAKLDDFRRIATEFAHSLNAGDSVALSGEMGAGKTTFVRAVVLALHGSERASSPTFIFRHTYPGTPPIEHLDLYRLDDPAEALELGLHEAFEIGAIVFVEWPDRMPGLLPPKAIRIGLTGCGDDPREIAIERPA
jgi:tRNA threonylcarbamoyl adenosine modification protein YjeE